MPPEIFAGPEISASGLDGPRVGLMSPQGAVRWTISHPLVGATLRLVCWMFSTGVKFRDMFLSAAFFRKESGNMTDATERVPPSIEIADWDFVETKKMVFTK
jgi:hypothetical protein